MKLSRAATALVLAGAALVASAAPALAHTELTGSTPAAGAALATPPAKVELRVLADMEGQGERR